MKIRKKKQNRDMFVLSLKLFYNKMITKRISYLQKSYFHLIIIIIIIIESWVEKNVNAKNKTKTIPAFFLVKHHKTYAEVVEQDKK
jgi:hypothetical protein